MVGKKIIVVSNLQPAKLRGVDSNGMLLAAESGEIVSLLTIDKDVEPGSKIH
jgi:methionyl-tRNA synthetase